MAACSLPPGITYKVTCGLTACTPGSAPGPTLDDEYGKTLPFVVVVVVVLPLFIQLEREDYGMKSNAVLLHGQWSPVKHRVPAEKVNNSMANNELLKLLPTQLLPVHRHLQRQAGKEQEQVPYTESSDVEPTKDSDPQLCTSSPPERNFQKTFSVSVDSANTISEGQ